MIVLAHFLYDALALMLVCFVLVALVLGVIRVDDSDRVRLGASNQNVKGLMTDERKTYLKQLSIARAAYEASVQLSDHASAQLNAESMAAAHRRLALLDEQERKQREGEGVV